MINVNESILDLADENEMFLILQLSRHLDKKNSAFPSNKKLCELTKWSLKKLQKIKKQCIEKSFISVQERRRDNDNGVTSNLYKIPKNYLTKYTKGAMSQNDLPPMSQNYPRGMPLNDLGAIGQNDSPPLSQNDPYIEVLKEEVLINEVLIKLKKKIGQKQFELIAEYQTDLSEKKFAALVDFLEYRKEQKKPYKSKLAIQKIIKQFGKFTDEEIIESINKSITNGYQGFFPKKIQSNGTGKSNGNCTIFTTEDAIKTFKLLESGDF